MERKLTDFEEKSVKIERIDSDYETLPFDIKSVKEEPPVEFLLILPPATIVEAKEVERVNETVSRESCKPKAKCPICFKIVKQTWLKTHLELHKKVRKFVCDLCGHGCVLKFHLAEHMWKHRHEKRFKCEICGKGSNYKYNLNYHRLTHIDRRPYKCDLCPKEYVTRQLVDRHLKKIHFKTCLNIVPKKVNCRLCDKVFSDKIFMKRHIERFHGKNFWKLLGK